MLRVPCKTKEQVDKLRRVMPLEDDKIDVFYVFTGDNSPDYFVLMQKENEIGVITNINTDGGGLVTITSDKVAEAIVLNLLEGSKC